MPIKKRMLSSELACAAVTDGCLVDERGPLIPGNREFAADEIGTQNRKTDSRAVIPDSTIAAKNEETAARERALVLAAQAGDANAIRTIYEAHRDRVWTILLYMLGDRLLAQDVLQAVFFKVFRGLSGFRFQSSLPTWIHRIAHNECLNAGRRRPAPVLPLEVIVGRRDEIDPRDTAGESDARLEREQILKQAIMRLSPKMREVIVLKYVEDMSYEEIGRALGCASGTVASRLSRALSELGERLGPFRRLM